MKIDPSSPAFSSDVADGMTIRTYLAGQAPTVPAAWFVPRNNDRPSWSSLPRTPMPHGTSATVGHCPKCDEYFKKQEELERERDKARSDWEMRCYIEWPVAWADALIAELNKGGAQ